MNERPAKLGAWGYLLLTAVTLVISIYFFFFDSTKGNIALFCLPIWMGDRKSVV